MLINLVKQKLNDDSSSKLAVFIRHGEKNKYGSDPALLTERAKEEAAVMGLRFKELKTSMKLYSSPQLRCVQTAKIFNYIISDANDDIILTTFLGEPGIHVKDNTKYLELFKKSDAREIYDQWKLGRYHDALRTIDELYFELTCFLKKTCTGSKISLFVSQSGTIAALGYALGLSNYDTNRNEWVPFLDGFVIAY